MARYIATYNIKNSRPMDLFEQMTTRGIQPCLHNVSNGIIEIELASADSGIIETLDQLVKKYN